MKRMILSATLLLFLAGIAKAQTETGNSSRNTSAVSSSSKTRNGKQTKRRNTVTSNKSTTMENVEVTTTADNRREYVYPNGQASTPSGHDATPVNGGYAALGRSDRKSPPPKKIEE